MVAESVPRCLRNLMAYIVSKPPCVIFTLCLALLAVALFFLGYYVNNNEVVDPEAQKDWDNFLTGLSNIKFCLNENNMDIISSIKTEKPLNMSSSSFNSYNSLFQKDFVQISVPLKIGITLWKKFHHLHGNISHLTTVVNTPVVHYGIPHTKMNLTFSLTEIWNTEKQCNKNGKCKLPQGVFSSCVTIMAPRDVMPEWKPSTCNSSSIVMMNTMTQLSVKEQRSKKCQTGAVVYFKHPVNLKLREKLSVDERAKANLHLQLSSYFLFVLVITSIIYGMVRGKATKLKKVTFELGGV